MTDNFVTEYTADVIQTVGVCGLWLSAYAFVCIYAVWLSDKHKRKK